MGGLEFDFFLDGAVKSTKFDETIRIRDVLRVPSDV